jgi:GNAT superfamily N-acetyltransferase
MTTEAPAVAVSNPSPADALPRGATPLFAAAVGLIVINLFGIQPLVAEIAAQYVKNLDPEKENAWIAERDGQVVGSVFLVKVSEQEAKLRLLYVEPEMRGTGLGRRLTQECIAFAKARGYQTLSLWTNDILHAARHIYQTAGFVLLSEEPHYSFGHDLVGQYWALDLRN